MMQESCKKVGHENYSQITHQSMAHTYTHARAHRGKHTHTSPPLCGLCVIWLGTLVRST